MRAGRAKFALARPERGDLDRGRAYVGRQREADLAPAGELDIDLGEELRVPSNITRSIEKLPVLEVVPA